MKGYSIFDIIGPIMIGPSSSHTGGAVRIGYAAGKIFNEEIKKVKIYFHGSFSKTYKGHGTDKGVIAGLCGMREDDSRIKHILSNVPFEYEIESVKLKNVHPNTVMLEISNDNKKMCITGSSIGAGKFKIIEINKVKVDFGFEYNTVICYGNKYKDFEHEDLIHKKIFGKDEIIILECKKKIELENCTYVERL